MRLFTKEFKDYAVKKEINGNKRNVYDVHATRDNQLNDLNDLLLMANNGDLMIIYILLLLCKKKIDGGFSEYTIICFDNLDVKQPIFIYQDIIKLTHDIYTTIMNFFQKNKGTYFDKISSYLDSHFKFLFCIREASASKVSHYIARIQGNSVSKKFIGLYDINDNPKRNNILLSEMLKRRVNLYRFIANDSKYDEIFDFIVHLSNDSNFIHRMCQIFNYNYREIVKFFIFIIDKYNVNSDFLKLYNNLIEKYKFAARGIIYNLIIDYMSANMQLVECMTEEVIGKDGIPIKVLNPARKIMTYILDINAGDGAYYNVYKIRDTQTTLGDVFRKFLDYYDFSILKKAILYLYSMHQDEKFCNFVSFYFRDIRLKRFGIMEKEFVFTEELENATEVEKWMDDCFLVPNPSSFMYLRFLIIHFEWYLYRNTYRNNKKNDSLFTSVKKNVLTKKHIRETYNYVNTSIMNASKNFNEILDIMEGNSALEKLRSYLRSSMSFRFTGTDNIESKSREMGYLHSIRIIDSHVSYLDQLRSYYIESNILNENDTKDISNFICSYLMKYIDILIREFPQIFGETKDLLCEKHKYEIIDELIMIRIRYSISCIRLKEVLDGSEVYESGVMNLKIVEEDYLYEN